MAKARRSLRDQFPRFEPRNRADWRRWLGRNGGACPGIWLVFLKGDRRQLTYADAVEEALCHGWIDSTLNPIDGERYMQLFTPRKPKSGWSKLNKDRIARLTRAGLMAEPGLAAIALAKQNGSWKKLDGVESLQPPPDLVAALARHPVARANFDALRPFSRKMYLYRVTNVKGEATRARRIAEAIAGLERNWTHPLGPAARPAPATSARPRSPSSRARGSRDR